MFSTVLSLKYGRLHYLHSLVPGHSEIEGNEKADALHRQEALTIPIGPESIMGVPLLLKRHKIKKKES